jgi:Icc protein
VRSRSPQAGARDLSADYAAAVTFTLVQLTDPHIGAPWSTTAAVTLAQVVEAVGEVLPAAPDAVIVSGDIANTPTAAEYKQARSLLDVFNAPLYVLPGNHDDRGLLRTHFDIPAAEPDALSYVADLGPLRLVALDTVRPGHGAGQLDPPRLRWLDRVLGEDTTTPTLLAMHHVPVLTGLPAMDAIGIPPDERRALRAIVSRHRQVELIAAGHVHRTVVAALDGVPVLAVPSTGVQLALDLEDDELRFASEPPCFALHLFADGQLVSHIQPVQQRLNACAVP